MQDLAHLADDVLLTSLKRLTGTSNELTAQVLARARYRRKREIEKLVAELAPRDDVPARIEPLHVAARPAADHATMMAALCGPVRRLPQGNGRGEAPVGALAELELAGESSVPSPSSLPDAAPLPAPMHYKVQFTADQDYMSLLEEARDLLAHVNPTRDFVEVQRRALEDLVDRLRKRKHAARAGAEPASAEARVSTSSGPAAESAAPARRAMAAELGGDASEAQVACASQDDARGVERRRRPTAAVARGVWQRDQSRCTYVDVRGQRCRETSMLEYHHEQPWACGGPTTIDNLSLRCATHNALAAEEDFGRALMRRKRGADPEIMPRR